MSIWRGAQSAIFYYLSCAPCHEASIRKQRKREAKRERADKVLLEQEFGGDLYRHPSPSATNPHWQTEIAFGPTMQRGKRKTNTPGLQRGLRGSAPGSSNTSDVASSVDLSRKLKGDKGNSKLDVRRYQREDEELWGSEITVPPLRSYLDGSSEGTQPTKPQKARTRDASSYQSYRNPQLSDIHPAIVTKVHSRDDVAWMLQPPPVAEVMSGKERPPRSRSGSGSSRPTTSGGRSLSRQVSYRLIEQKLRNGETAAPTPSRTSSGHASSFIKGSRLDAAGISAATERKDFAASPSVRRKRRPSPITTTQEASDDSASTVLRKSTTASEPVDRKLPKKVASRPQLSTILSDSLVPPEDDTDFYTPAETPKENSLPNFRGRDSSPDSYDRFARRKGVDVVDHSGPLLQTSAPNTPHFNEKIFPAVDSKVPSPASDGADDRDVAGGAELSKVWYEPDFSLGKWVHEHTKREVRQRWSMDL